VSFRKIPIVMVFRELSVNTLPYIFFINWSSLHLKLFNVLIGMVMLAIGLVIWHCFMFVLAFLVFWFGESKHMFYMGEHFFDTKNPYESFPKQIRWFLIFIVPSLLIFALPVSVALGKINYQNIIYSLFVVSVFIWLKNWVWHQGLKRYTSAS